MLFSFVSGVYWFCAFCFFVHFKKAGLKKILMYVHLWNSSVVVMANYPIINSLKGCYRMSKNQSYPRPWGTCLWAAVNLHKSYHVLFIHVVDVRLRKMTLHTRRAPNNCGASGRASRTEIKQVLSHNPCLLKISLFRRGWWILGCILSSGCGGNCVISVELCGRDCT